MIPLGCKLGRTGVDLDDGGQLNIGMFTRAALLGSAPRPKLGWEGREGDMVRDYFLCL